MARRKSMNWDKTVDWTITVGAINWGLTVFNYNLVDKLADLVSLPVLSTVVYSLVGIAGVFKLLNLFKGR